MKKLLKIAFTLNVIVGILTLVLLSYEVFSLLLRRHFISAFLVFILAIILDIISSISLSFITYKLFPKYNLSVPLWFIKMRKFVPRWLYVIKNNKNGGS